MIKIWSWSNILLSSNFDERMLTLDNIVRLVKYENHRSWNYLTQVKVNFRPNRKFTRTAKRTQTGSQPIKNFKPIKYCIMNMLTTVCLTVWFTIPYQLATGLPAFRTCFYFHQLFIFSAQNELTVLYVIDIIIYNKNYILYR